MKPARVRVILAGLWLFWIGFLSGLICSALVACKHRPAPRPMSAETRAEIARSVREMDEATARIVFLPAQPKK